MKIHIGCGKRDFGDGWFNVDGEKHSHVHSDDVFLYNQECDTADLIYASHFIEYFDRKEVMLLLTEWHRVLKPGGVLRLSVPDIDALIDAYLWRGADLSEILGPMFGRMVMGDQIIYHKTVYNYEHLRDVLQKAGFTGERLWDYKATEHAAFDDCARAHIPHDPAAIKSGNFDPENHILISLNMEAVK